MTAQASIVAVAASSGPNRISARLPVAPIAVLQVLIFLLAFGNLGRIPLLDLGGRTAPLLINDLCLGAAIVVGVLVALRDRSLRLNDVAVAGVVFASIGALSTIAGIQRFGFSALEVIASLAYLARWCTYFAFYVVLINVARSRDVEALWRTLEWTMIVIVAFGIVQSVMLPNFAFTLYSYAEYSHEFDAQRNRLVSTILDPNLVAAMIVLTLLVQLARVGSGARQAGWKPLLLFAGLVLTLSRGGVLSLAVGCLVLLPVLGLSKRILRLGLALLAGLIVATPKLIEFAGQYARFSVTDESAMLRVISWQRALATFLEYPIFGIGFNTYGFVQDRRGYERISAASYSTEGGLLFVAVLTGIVGLAVYVAMTWFVWRRSRLAARHPLATPEERGLLRGTVAATAAILVNSLFANSLMTPWVLEPLLLLWALAFVVASDLRGRTAGTSPFGS